MMISRKARWTAALLFLAAPLLIAASPAGQRILGCEYVGRYTQDCTYSSDSVAMSPDASVVLYTLPGPLQQGEGIDLMARVNLEFTGDAGLCTGGGCKGRVMWDLSGSFRNGQFLTTDGGSSGDIRLSSLASPLNSCVTWLSATDAGVLQQYASCNVPAAGGVGWDLNRRLPYGTIASVSAVSPNLVATRFASPQTISITCPRGCSAASAAAVGVGISGGAGVALSGVTSASDGAASGVLAANVTYTAGTGSTVLVAPASPAVLASSFTFATAGVTAPLSPVNGPPTGGTTLTIPMNVGATGGCATPPTVCGVPTTSCVVNSDQSITAVTPAHAVATCDVVVTSPSCLGPSNTCTLTNGYAYVNAPPTLTTLPYPLLARADGNEQVLTLPGLSLTGVTGVTVNGVSATSVSSTSTTVTFKPPANTSSGSTAYSIVVTNPNGSATAALGAAWSNSTNVIYYVPTATPALWACGQGTTGAPVSAWADVIGGVSATQGTGAQQPTITTINSSKYCQLTFSGSQALAAASYTCPAQTYAVTVAGYHSAGGIQNWLQTSSPEINAYFDSVHVSLYGGGSLGGTLTATSMSWIYWTYGGGASGVNINGANGGTGSGGTNVCGGQFVLGAANSAGTNGLNGGMVFLAIDSTGGNSAFWHTLSQTLAGTP